MSNTLELKDISKAYNVGKPNEVQVLGGVDLTLAEGEIVALVAPSGAGKSTLLHIAGLLESPDEGEVVVCGEAASELRDGRRTQTRRDKVGFVYQFHHLLPEFNAAENVILPQLAAGVARKAAAERARVLLDSVGVSHRAKHRPAEMSGGEQQRVAFCRAMANGPALLLADEPTGNLDPATSDTVFEALMALAKETGLAALIATHNPDLAARMDRVVQLEAGLIVGA